MPYAMIPLGLVVPIAGDSSVSSALFSVASHLAAICNLDRRPVSEVGYHCHLEDVLAVEVAVHGVANQGREIVCPALKYFFS